jgi:hypothetical protein
MALTAGVKTSCRICNAWVSASLAVTSSREAAIRSRSTAFWGSLKVGARTSGDRPDHRAQQGGAEARRRGSGDRRHRVIHGGRCGLKSLQALDPLALQNRMRLRQSDRRGVEHRASDRSPGGAQCLNGRSAVRNSGALN